MREMQKEFSYPLLEFREVCGAESICLGNDGDKVHSGAEPLHDLNVEGLEGVACGADEVQAGVHT